VVFCRYQSRFTDAARVFEKAGHVDLAIEMFLDLKRYDDAKNYAGKGSSKHSVSDLMKRQAEWSKATADWRSASEMYVSVGGWWLVVVFGWLVVLFGGGVVWGGI
jgi:intraflagellar transport protein 122